MEIWNWQWPEEKRLGDNGGKKGKGLVKEPVWMTHGHGQQRGNWLWQQGGGMGGGGKRGKNWDNHNRITIKNDLKKQKMKPRFGSLKKSI